MCCHKSLIRTVLGLLSFRPEAPRLAAAPIVWENMAVIFWNPITPKVERWTPARKLRPKVRQLKTLSWREEFWLSWRKTYSGYPKDAGADPSESMRRGLTFRGWRLPDFQVTFLKTLITGLGEWEGMEAEQERGKTKRFLVPCPTKNPARAGWPKRLGLVRASP